MTSGTLLNIGSGTGLLPGGKTVGNIDELRARADRNWIFVLLIMRVTIFDVCFHYTIYVNLMELI